MQIGDLVRYGNDKDYGIGIIVKINYGKYSNNFDTVTVLWGNGVTSSHAGRYIIRVKETA